MRGYFRWKMILICVALFALLSAGWYFAHQYRMRSLNARFLEQATKDEESGKLDRAARFYRLYLYRKGDDAAAWAKSGLLKQKRARDAGSLLDALRDYETALADDKSAGETLLDSSTRNDIRLRSATIDLLLGKIDDGLIALGKLPRDEQATANIQFLFGEAYRMKKDLGKAKASYWNVITADPKKLEAYGLLAAILQADGNSKGTSPETKQPADPAAMPADAIGVYNRLVKNNPQDHRAYVMRVQFRRGMAERERSGGPKDTELAKDREAFIEQDLAKARELAPDDVEVLLVSAFDKEFRARTAGSADARAALLVEARSYLERKPTDPRILAARVDLELAEKHIGVAIGLIRDGLKEAKGKEKDRLLWQLAALSIDQNELNQAKDAIKEIEKNDPRAPYVPLLRGKILMRSAQWRAASDELNAGRPRLRLAAASRSFVDMDALLVETELLLARCESKLADPDKEIAALQRATEAAPDSATARLALVKGLLATGSIEKASGECDRLMKLAKSPEIDLLFARILLSKTLNVAPANRRWKEVNAELTKLAAAHPEMVELQLLHAQAAAIQKNFKESRTILDKAIAKDPKVVEYWVALSNLAAAEGKKSEASKILDQAQMNLAKQKLGNHPLIIMARLGLATTEDSPPTLEMLRLMKTEIDGLKTSEQAVPLQMLAASFEIAGDKKEAERLWSRYASLQKGDLAAQETLFRFYLRNDDREGLAKTLPGIVAIEGEGGPIGHYGEALVSILEAQRKDGKVSDAKRLALLAKAREHLKAAGNMHPAWPLIPETLAVVASIAEDDESALNYLRQAFSLNVSKRIRNPRVVRALLGRLLENGMSGEADDVLRQVQELSPVETLETGTLMLGAETSMVNQNLAPALEMAMSAVSEKSGDYKEYLWKGRFLGALGKQSEAEKALFKSIELAKGNPDPWVALVQVRARGNKVEDAKAAIEQMKSKVPADKLDLALAQSYQSIGEKDLAEAEFRKAIAARPDDWAALLATADFYRANKAIDKAETILLHVADSKTNAPRKFLVPARRNLAYVLAAKNDPRKLLQALALVDENLRMNRLNADDQIAKGTFLAMSAERRQEAIDTLQKAFKSRTPRPEQLFLLSSLYDAMGDWRNSRSVMDRLLRISEKTNNYPELIAVYVGKLMAHDEIDDADPWLRRLKDLKPHAYMTFEGWSRYWAIQDRPDEILAALKGYLGNKESEPADLAVQFTLTAQQLGGLVESYPKLRSRKFLGAVETNLVSFASKTGKRESLLNLAKFYGHAGELEKCLKTCEQVLPDLPPLKVLNVAVPAIATNSATPEQFERAEGWIKSADSKKETEFDAREVLAAILKERQEKYGDAEAIYRQALKKSSRNLVAANNLAFLLGLQKKEEATRLIDSTVAASNRNPEALDSRATILLALGKPGEAEADLRESLANGRTAVRLYHLALQEDLAKNSTAASRTFDEAIRRGLRVEMLHPLEREGFRRIQHHAGSSQIGNSR